MHKLLLAASVLCIATTAHAESFSSVGSGTMTCAKFYEHRNDPGIEELFFVWAQGFMSGLNDALEDTIAKYRDLHSLSTDQQKQILSAFCAKNPASLYRDGIHVLLSGMTIVPSTLKNAPANPLQRRLIRSVIIWLVGYTVRWIRRGSHKDAAPLSIPLPAGSA